MPIVTCAIIEKDGKILIARRKRGDQMGGKWEFPGGTVEDNETPEPCLRRELKEELGVEIGVKEFVCSSRSTDDHAPITLLAFTAALFSDELTLYAHDEIRWVSPGDLARYDFPEADTPIIQHLIAAFDKA